MMRTAAVALVLLAQTQAHADRPWTGYKLVPAAHALTPTGVLAAPSSSIIYLHRCPSGGCLVHSGTIDDSRTDTSSIADPGDHSLSMFKESDEVWQAAVQCVKDTYAPFAITITDVDPGPVPHFEEMVGGTPDQLLAGFAQAGGIAPFDCAEIPNGISFTFDVWGANPDELCWTIAQETAHTFGLEHEYSAKDPMTYVQGYLPKRFQWEDAPCGTNSPGGCQCPHASQNSYRSVFDMFGIGSPSPPTVTIKSPADGKTVTPNFKLLIDATDDAAIDHLELWIDGAMTDMTATTPYVFHAPTLDLGAHTIEVRAIDVTGMPASQSIAITQGPPCTDAAGCTGTDVCVSGNCIAGPAEPGGLGDTCLKNPECLSLICAAGPNDTLMHCVAECDPSKPSACPNDFDCVPAGSTTVCWPSAGCCSVGGDPRGSGILACVALGLVLRRRRR
jgi:hypothetical protein